MIRNNYKRIVKEENKGITLIALVITIIVLLILAGVTIAMLTGENGILNKANTAKTETEIGKIEEQKKLTQAEANMNLEETTYTDKEGKTITIPKEIAVSQTEGENEIDKGLVVIDKNGNEWVWIEVPKTETVFQTSGINLTNFDTTALSNIENDLKTYTSDYRGIYTDEWYEGCGIATPEEYNILKNRMLESVYTNKGFFIGRYEAGTNVARNTSNDQLTQEVIKQDMYPYNFVTCKQAQEKSTELSIGGKTSSLMFGIQWDLVCKYIEEKAIQLGETKADRQTKIKIDSSNWGNYNNIKFDINRGKYSIDYGSTFTVVSELYTKQVGSVLVTTGASQRNKVLNMYDFAGNVWEWTIEKSTGTTSLCVARGGRYSGAGNDYPASYRYNANITNSSNTIAFRSTVY